LTGVLNECALAPEPLAAPEPPVVIPCACCGGPATGIGELGLTVCARCEEDGRERAVLAYEPGGIRELRALFNGYGAPVDGWWALYWKAPTVEAVKRLAAGPGRAGRASTASGRSARRRSRWPCGCTRAGREDGSRG
jgi:hypothetical protein